MKMFFAKTNKTSLRDIAVRRVGGGQSGGLALRQFHQLLVALAPSSACFYVSVYSSEQTG